jgi:hypothetical protein
MKKIAIIVLGVVAALIVIGIIASGGSDTPGRKTTTDRSAVADAPAKAVEGPATSFTDGTFLVGSDIEAGTYKTSGPADDAWVDGCYWERNKDDSGDFESIIANEYQEGPGRVTVGSGEIFKTSGDCEWALVR